MITCKVH